MKPRNAAWLARLKRVIRDVIVQMADEGRHASTRNIALGLRCPIRLVRTLRQELVRSGELPPWPEDHAWLGDDDDDEEVPADYRERLAIVHEAKLRQYDVLKSWRGLPEKQLEKILP